jgi:hypothetical protein
MLAALVWSPATMILARQGPQRFCAILVPLRLKRRNSLLESPPPRVTTWTRYGLTLFAIESEMRSSVV